MPKGKSLHCFIHVVPVDFVPEVWVSSVCPLVCRGGAGSQETLCFPGPEILPQPGEVCARWLQGKGVSDGIASGKDKLSVVHLLPLPSPLLIPHLLCCGATLSATLWCS